MSIYEKNLAELKIYLKKLVNAVQNEASWDLFVFKLINKRRIDDLLCCLEASLPEAYKKIIERKGKRAFQSSIAFVTLRTQVFTPFALNKNMYKVKLEELRNATVSLEVLFKSDLAKLEQGMDNAF